MSNARNLANLLGTDTKIKTADIANEVFNSNRNLVINGAMQVAQRGTSATGLGDGSDAYHTVDRIQTKKGSAATAGRFTMTQSDVTDLAGFPNAVKFQCTTADTSIAASEAMFFQYSFEGQDLQSIMETSSSSKAFTVSFYAKANESRAFVLEVRTSGGTNRQISKLFTASASWQRFEFNVPAAASGMQINNDNSNEMQLNFWLHAGSTYAGGTLDTDWAGSTNANRAAGTGSLFASTSNFFEMTGLQLEVGEQATPFEHRSYGDELQRCKRYFQKVDDVWFNANRHGDSNWDGHVPAGHHEFHPEMRAAPSASNVDIDGWLDNTDSWTSTSTNAANPTGMTSKKVNFTGVWNWHGNYNDTHAFRIYTAEYDAEL